MQLQFPGLANVVRSLEIVLGLGISWLFIIYLFIITIIIFNIIIIIIIIIIQCVIFPWPTIASIVKSLSFHKKVENDSAG